MRSNSRSTIARFCAICSLSIALAASVFGQSSSQAAGQSAVVDALRGLADVPLVTARHLELEATLVLPLYYTGLTDTATVRIEAGQPVRHSLDRKFQLPLPLRVGARNWTWLVIE